MPSTQKIAPGTKIVPHLWFAEQAVEAANFYVSLFPDSYVNSVTPIPADTPSGPAGSVPVVEFTLFGQPFMAISAGPLFNFNPSVSFVVVLQSTQEVEALWEKLIPGGKALMDIGEYPFSRRYGWLEDKYGVSWQLICIAEPAERRIVPTLMFVGDVCGKAEEAINHYTSVFGGKLVGDIVRYSEGQEPDRPGTVVHAEFELPGQVFAAMDSAYPHDFGFNEAISFMVLCETQEDIDYLWGRLSAVPEAEQCGWLKDRFGISWQIVPASLGDLMKDPDRDRARRVMEAMLQMEKLDIAGLQRAYTTP